MKNNMERTSKNIIELMSALGYELEFNDEAVQMKLRFSNDDRFIDVWNGKKRLSIGIYYPQTKSMGFTRCQTIEEFEKIITNIKEN